MKRAGISVILVVAFTILMPIATLAVGDEFVMANYTDTRTLDPQRIHDYQSGLMGWNIYEGLLEYDVADFSIRPLLATSWEVHEDGMGITFQLRQGVAFHDGTSFNAEAVVYSMERLLDLGDSPASFLETITRWEVEDDYTISFYSDGVWAFWEDAFASHKGLLVVSPTFAKAHATEDDPWAEDWLVDNSSGTGPYKLAEWLRGQYIKGTWNEDYWAGWPTDREYFKSIVLRYVPEVSIQTLQMKNGEVDYSSGINPRDVPELQANPDVQVDLVNAVAQQFIFFNSSKPPLDNVSVREAICRAIDYESVNATYLPGLKTAQGILSSTMPSFLATIPQSSQDMVLAKQLFAQSGYKAGEITLELVPIAGTWQSDGALVIQQNLAELGITVNINPLPWSIYQNLRLDVETMPQMSFMYLELFLADPIGIIKEAFTPGAIFKIGYMNEAVGTLAALAETLPTREERWGIYKGIQELVYPDFPAIYLHERQHVFTYRADVKGYVPDAMHLSIDVHSLWRD